ncbi:stromelysin-3-like [Gouania willdenowi]|uniref:Stromelysin-3-like n=1 Tax=Gouania willdenowi TaxID=441366 RepID=A0A8C5GBG7_GOUWI|nr:stromelysin-3-like [Gouania willdenowi]
MHAPQGSNPLCVSVVVSDHTVSVEAPSVGRSIPSTMRAELLLWWIICRIFCGESAPVGGRRSSTPQQGWPGGQGLLKNNGKHLQNTLSEEKTRPYNHTDWKRPRCGVPDFPNFLKVELTQQKKQRKDGRKDGRKQQRQRRFALFGGRWDKTDLTYKILRFPWQMSEDKVRAVLHQAFTVWSSVTPLSFTEVSTDKADIKIDFNRYWHGDSLPFDGPGGILAHAFFPRTHRAGEVHFDYDEHWTLGNSVGTDLLQVAAHEFGHALGLQHSLEPEAVMCPFYSDSYPVQLSDDDRKGIQYLYGPPRPPPPDLTETNEVESVMPDACRSDFDAVSMIRGELFFFKSQYVWRIRDGRLQPGYPALSSRHWRGIPDHIDAAYEDKSGNIWFFQGDSFWVFDAERRISGPDSVWRLGLPVGNIQAALKWEENQQEKVFFFRSSSFWSLDVNENFVEDVRPRSMHRWRGVPENIQGAFWDKYGYVNFLSGQQYWRFDPVALTITEGFPRSIGQDFFGCPSSPY